MSDYIPIPVNKRVICEYSIQEQEIMRLKKNIILTEIQILGLTGVSVIYDSQEIIALKIITELKNKKIINVMAVLPTQGGKTGTMCATIKKYLEDTTNLIPIENIYIITGVSSCEWKEQTKERLPASLQSRVFHRCDLPVTFVDEIKTKKNILIIMDEVQVAAKKDQTIYKSFQSAGLLDKSKLYENDVKILEFTATPDGTIYDLMKWNDASSKIIGEPGDGYVSCFDLLRQGRIKQYKELCGNGKDDMEKVLENIKEIKTDIDSYSEIKWHIIRTKNGIFQDRTIENFKKVFIESETNKYNFIKYDRESEIADINNTLKTPPKTNTIIFIKEMLRCSKTLYQQHLGLRYERFSLHPDDACIVQGLLGRSTGYQDNRVSICYTNIESILRYEQLWNSNFEDNTIKWNSKTTKYINGTLVGKNTFNDPSYYEFSDDDSTTTSSSLNEPIIKKFKTYDEAKEYYNTSLKAKLGGKGRGPNKLKPNDAGFYESNIRKNKRVYSCDEIYKERRCNIENGAGYGFRACYEDITNKDTLQLWLIHY